MSEYCVGATVRNVNTGTVARIVKVEDVAGAEGGVVIELDSGARWNLPFFGENHRLQEVPSSVIPATGKEA